MYTMHVDNSNIQPLITPPLILAPFSNQSLSHLYDYSFYFVNLLSLMRVFYVPVGLELLEPPQLNSGFSSEENDFPSLGICE